MKEFLVTYLEPAEAIDDAIEIMEIHALGGMKRDRPDHRRPPALDRDASLWPTTPSSPQPEAARVSAANCRSST